MPNYQFPNLAPLTKASVYAVVRGEELGPVVGEGYTDEFGVLQLTLPSGSYTAAAGPSAAVGSANLPQNPQEMGLHSADGTLWNIRASPAGVLSAYSAIIPTDQIALDHVVTSIDIDAWDHECAGSNRALIISVAASQAVAGTGSITAINYGGVALTRAVTRNYNDLVAEIWYLAAPAAGFGTITVATSGALTARRYTSISLTSVHQTAPLDATSSAGSIGTSASLAHTTASAQTWLIDLLAINATTVASGSGQVDLATSGVGAPLSRMSRIGPVQDASVRNMTWTWNGEPQPKAHVAASFAPAQPGTQLTATQIPAGTITATEIGPNAITSPKIAANAVTANKILAGAITADLIGTGSLAAGVIIMAGSVTANTNRVEISPAGIKLISRSAGNVDTTKVSLDTATGAGTITGGIIQTAASGGRIVLDPGADTRKILLYPGSAVNETPASIEVAPGISELDIYSPMNAGGTQSSINLQGGLSALFPSSIQINAVATTFNSYVKINSAGDASLTSNTHPFQIGYDVNSNLIMDDNEIMARNAGGTATLHLNLEGGDVTLANSLTATTVTGSNGFTSLVQDAGMFFPNNAGTIEGWMTNRARTVYRPLRASAFPVGSMREFKQEIGPLPFDALAVVKSAPASSWEYRPDYADTGGHRLIGPMADDLPSELVGVSGSVDLLSLIGTLWEAVGQLADQQGPVKADQHG